MFLGLGINLVQVERSHRDARIESERELLEEIESASETVWAEEKKDSRSNNLKFSAIKLCKR